MSILEVASSMKKYIRLQVVGYYLIIIFSFVFLHSCENDEGIDMSSTYVTLSVPDHFPTPAIPADNPLTEEKIALGRMLFFDPILSKDSTISCSSCHLPGQAFSDPRQFSEGVNQAIGIRNSPALVNLVYGKRFFWDGANPSLEEQAIHPIVSEIEMAGDPATIIQKLNAHPVYPREFQRAFGEEASMKTIVDAIASFERVLISANSPYDQYLLGDSSALSPSQKRGMSLFFNHQRGECFHCHTGSNFTDGSFHNNGLYEEYNDPGRMAVTGRDNDEGKFKVPTLRNIEFSKPYMHDGSMETLEEVVDHYAKGGNGHRNQSVLLRNIEFSEEEKKDLVEFLKALSDQEFIDNKDFHRPQNIR